MVAGWRVEKNANRDGAMKFDPGDHVHVAHFGKGIVREVRNGGRYLVELKGRSMVVAESQVTAGEQRKPRRRDVTVPTSQVIDNLARPHSAPSIDLHGLTTVEAIEALDAFLDDALLASREEVRVIHGRSGGRLKAAVHERLRSIAAVRSFHVDHLNPGVTIVVF